MINSVNNYRTHLRAKPAFGAVIQARVVLRTLNPTGVFEYLVLKNNEKGISGVYQSLARRVQTPKGKNIVDKLSRFIPDFSPDNTILRSTKIGAPSIFKRFLLTDAEAREIDFCGRKFIGYDKNKSDFILAVKNIVYRGGRRVKNAHGKEIGVDLIVEGKQGQRKLVDIDVIDAVSLNWSKPTQQPAPKPIITPKKIVKFFQPEFDFFTNKVK